LILDKFMKREDLTDDIEERADQLLGATLDLSEAEVDGIYNSARPDQDPRQRAYELARRAAALCEAEQRAQPDQLQAALATLAQLDLPLENKPSPALPRVLLIDQDANRLLARKKLFLERHIDIETTTSASDGVARLEMEAFQLVIVDYFGTSAEEQAVLLKLQEFNLHAPVINVRAWFNLVHADNRRLNRDLLRAAARLFGKEMPRSLPRRRPPTVAGSPAPEQTLFNAG
jgi:hypothetical protein